MYEVAAPLPLTSSSSRVSLLRGIIYSIPYWYCAVYSYDTTLIQQLSAVEMLALLHIGKRYGQSHTPKVPRHQMLGFSSKLGCPDTVEAKILRCAALL